MYDVQFIHDGGNGFFSYFYEYQSVGIIHICSSGGAHFHIAVTERVSEKTSLVGSIEVASK